MTINQIKTEEFQRRVYELSDEIFQGKVKSITMTQIQLEFYGVDLIDVLQTFSSLLEQLQEPTHPDDKSVIWKVFADKKQDKYQLKFTHKVS